MGKYVNMQRTRRVKTYAQIKALDDKSTDLFCPSKVDDQYPARPEELEDVCLYDFVKWYNIIKLKPKSEYAECYEFPPFGFIKKRNRPCLVSHTRYNVIQNPEKYYFSLLLLFKPWREIDELRGSSSTFAEAFNDEKDSLEAAMVHHEKLQEIKRAKDEIDKLVQDIAIAEKDTSQDNALAFDAIEAEGAMEEFRGACMEEGDLEEMIQQLNADQTRVFNYVTTQIGNPNIILRHFVSGVGGTGKSFLIKVIRLWIKQHLHKDVAVSAPTGIAAFNVNGMTIHRLFQLPIEHGSAGTYRKLTDDVLKILRDELRNTSLLIIDEISMVSNITLMFIHMRLSEIFNTLDEENGWFGKINLLLLGDLLQLPPVMEESPFIKITDTKCKKFISSLYIPNLWQEFTYDELTINMRQKEDSEYIEILSNIRMGMVTTHMLKRLQSRLVTFSSENVESRLNELAQYILSLPPETVCLLATRHAASTLNNAVLNLLPGEPIEITAIDSIECPKHQKSAEAKLKQHEDDSSRTAGVDAKLILKLGAKVMLRRNIDVTKGLVNGSIGTVMSMEYTSFGLIKSLKIQFQKQIHNLERIKTKFEILPKVYVYRKQFPISIAYGITIHKSQGLSLPSCIVDVGNTIFSCGQTYVALSRVTSIEGLHIINFDPKSVKAQASAITEYNRLRTEFRKDLGMLKITNTCPKLVADRKWFLSARNIVMQSTINSVLMEKNNRMFIGFENQAKKWCYANAILQCIFNTPILESILNEIPETQLKYLALAYHTGDSPILNSHLVRVETGEEFVVEVEQDAAEFFSALLWKHECIRLTTKHTLQSKIKCSTCPYTNSHSEENYIHLISVQPSSKPIAITKLLENEENWKPLTNAICSQCKNTSLLQKCNIEGASEMLIFQLKLFSNNQEKITDLKIKALPSTTIKINRQTYTLHAAVFHHGNSISGGHYTARVKSDKWRLLDDEKTAESSWPRNSKDAYMLFYTK